MRKLRENKALQDDLIACVSILGQSTFVVSANLKFKQWRLTIAAVGAVLLIAAMVLRAWRVRRNKRMTPEEQREAKRETSDERSQMLQSKAMEYFWQVENVLLLLALAVFIIRNQPAIYCVLYVALVVRTLGCTALRWWLEQKY